MARGITGKGPDPRAVYADIFDLPHWQSPDRPHMSLHDRAAQFAPYAALVGYDEMVGEEARLTEQQRILEGQPLEILNRKLSLIAEATAAGQHPELTFTVFIPDGRKAGGAYTEITDRVKRIDPAERKVVLQSAEGRGKHNITLDFERIMHIEGELVNHLEEG